MRWSLISVRFIAAIAVFGVVTCGSLLVALVIFQDLRGGFDRLRTQTIPELIDSGRIAQYSQAIASTAPQLGAVESDYARRSVNHEIEDQLRLLDSYLESLGGDAYLGSDEGQDALARIHAERRALVDNLTRLDETVRERLMVDRRFRAQLERLRDLMARATELNDTYMTSSLRSIAGEVVDPAGSIAIANLHEWFEGFDQMMIEGLTLAGLGNLALVRRNAERAQTLLDRLRIDLSTMAAVDRSVAGTLEGLVEPAADLLIGADSLFTTKSRLEELRRAQNGLLARNKILANRFVGASRGLSAMLQDATGAMSARFSRTAQESAVLLGVIIALGVVAVAGLWVYARRRVLSRLNRLRYALDAQRHGEAEPIPDEGRDEIAQIAQAARHFVDGLNEREQRLRLAKNQAEQLAAEAEAANRAKSVFLANMSHELRTPLNAIIGFSDLLVDGKAADRASEYAQDINDSGRHLLLLINDLLDYTKIEAGQRELSPAPIDAARTIRDLERLIRMQMNERGLSITYDFPEDTRITADPTAFRQVIVNLLSNAAKFSYDNETIRIAAVRVDGFLRVSVSDRGIGIATEEIARVMQPFHQETTSHTKSQGGTGLGLAIVDSLVRLHGGTTVIDSVKGEGATVTVAFPLIEVDPAPPDDDAPAPEVSPPPPASDDTPAAASSSG